MENKPWDEIDLQELDKNATSNELSAFLKDFPFSNESYEVKLFDAQMAPVKVLAIDSEQPTKKYWPIVTDIDIHCFADQYAIKDLAENNHRTYNTAVFTEREELQKNLTFFVRT